MIGYVGDVPEFEFCPVVGQEMAADTIIKAMASQRLSSGDTLLGVDYKPGRVASEASVA